MFLMKKPLMMDTIKVETVLSMFVGVETLLNSSLLFFIKVIYHFYTPDSAACSVDVDSASSQTTLTRTLETCMRDHFC